jgi:uncharacterized protein
MSDYFVFRLIPPRPTFVQDMNDDERATMGAHGEHWRPLIEAGRMIVFGPVLDGSGSWGLGVVEADDEAEVSTLVGADPFVTSGLGSIEMGRMLGGFVRPRPAVHDDHDAGAVRAT